jgi:DNA repair exonuclease SbcCD ATPase subunit
MIMRLEERCTPVARKRLVERVAREKAEATTIGENIKKAEGEKWDGQAALDRAEEKVTMLTVRIAREQGRLDKAAIAVDLATYCYDAYGDRGIRSLMVDNVADFVNERMAEHLDGTDGQ